MRKFSVLCVLLALLAGAGMWKLRSWRMQTVTQAGEIHAQIDRSLSFLQQKPDVWTNKAAEEALSRQAELSTDPDIKAEFVSPEGICFVSKSAPWDESKLKLLYEELLQNRHGEEIKTLMQVTVLPEENEDFLGYQSDAAFEYGFSPQFSLFPEKPLCSFYLDGSSIVLTDGDRKTTVESQAATLSHEYGHHYTKNYLLLSYGHAADLNRPYAKTRGLNSDNVYIFVSDSETYKANHYKALVEIAAEDYLVLMGSPNARKQIGTYCDVRDAAQGKTGDQQCLRNVLPQENMSLPFATKVPGLAELFYAPLNQSPPDYPQTGDMELRFERHEESFNLIDGYHSAVSYKIRWNKTLGENATYTLICKEAGDWCPQPIKTVLPGQPAEAEIGEIALQEQDYVRFYNDGRNRGTLQFLVVVTTEDGMLAVSDPVEKSL